MVRALEDGVPQAGAEQRLKVPPHSIEAEQSLLGGLMLDHKSWDKIADIVSESDFYRKDHRIIFAAIANLAEDANPCDVVTVSEHLDNRGELEEGGGLEYLATLSFILLIAVMVQLTELIMRRTSPLLYRILGIFLPLITTNCAVLGVAIINIQKEFDFVHTLVFSFASAVGFGLALVFALPAGAGEQSFFEQAGAEAKYEPWQQSWKKMKTRICRAAAGTASVTASATQNADARCLIACISFSLARWRNFFSLVRPGSWPIDKGQIAG